MVISTNNRPSINEFTILLDRMVAALNMDARNNAEYYLSRTGNKLEQDVYEKMVLFAKQTPFDGTIKLISGQKFPDIVAYEYYGVEVKTTTQNHWKTTGNSIMETTRVDGVERIFLLFGKLSDAIEFRAITTLQSCVPL